MKRFFATFSLLLACGMAVADELPPENVRVCAQYIEMPHAAANDLLAGEATDGAKLHAKALALTQEGKARILETSIAACSSGVMATVESIREEIYPTEYQPSDMPNLTPRPIFSKLPLRQFDAAFQSVFERRNTGVMLEILPRANGRLVDLRFAEELICRAQLDTWVPHTDRWGRANVSTPRFETLRARTRLNITAGKFALVAVITPQHQRAAPFEDSRILLFVRADVLDGP